MGAWGQGQCLLIDLTQPCPNNPRNIYLFISALTDAPPSCVYPPFSAPWSAIRAGMFGPTWAQGPVSWKSSSRRCHIRDSWHCCRRYRSSHETHTCWGIRHRTETDWRWNCLRRTRSSTRRCRARARPGGGQMGEQMRGAVREG